MKGFCLISSSRCPQVLALFVRCLNVGFLRWSVRSEHHQRASESSNRINWPNCMTSFAFTLSKDDGPMLTAVSRRVPSNLLDWHNHPVQFVKRWNNWVSFIHNVYPLNYPKQTRFQTIIYFWRWRVHTLSLFQLTWSIQAIIGRCHFVRLGESSLSSQQLAAVGNNVNIINHNSRCCRTFYNHC